MDGILPFEDDTSFLEENSSIASNFYSAVSGGMSDPTPSAGGVAATGVSGGFVRPKRRVVKNLGGSTVIPDVTRNYAVSSGVKFTNFTELKNDMMSPQYAQEVIEDALEKCGIDTSNSEAAKMAEDVIFTFYVQNAASQKTGHEKVVDIYGKELDIMVILRILVSLGETPRRFTRGLADRIYTFLREPESAALRADLVSKYSLENADHASIAFDGSTHITNLTTDRRQIANMLSSRGIYENEASMKNAADRTTYDGVVKGAGVRTGTLHNGA